MKWLLIAVIAVLVMALVGWLSFERTPDRAAINIETKEIREDAQQAVEKGRELFDRRGNRPASEQEASGDRPADTAEREKVRPSREPSPSDPDAGRRPVP